MRYMFVNMKDYPAYKIKYQACHVNLDFLPTLKGKDTQLHDMVIDMIALVSKCNKLPLWDEDGVYSTSLEKFIELSSGRSDSKLMMDYLHLYTKGPAAQYLKLIKSRRRHVTIESLEYMLHRYKPSSNRKREMCYAVRAAIALAKTKGTIDKFDYSPNFNKGVAMPAGQLYKFVWTTDATDPVFVGADIDYPCGMFLPTMVSIAKPGQVLKPIDHSDVPVKIFQLMDMLNRHFWSYRQYYYMPVVAKSKYAYTRVTRTASDEKTLIDVLEKVELKEMMELVKQANNTI